MAKSLDKILAWKPFARRRGARRHVPHDRRITAGTDLARDRRPPVPRREVAIAVLAGLNVAFTPWYYAGQDLNAQWIALAISSAAFAFLFLPVGYDEWRSASPRRSLETLLASPPFWIGLVLMIYFALQGANLRLDVEFDDAFWQLFPRKHVEWLPSGVNAPLSIAPSPSSPGGMNAFREMLIFGPMWLTFTALWCGVRSRRVIHWLVRGVLCSALVLAVFAIGMRAAHDTMIYNSISTSVGSAYGPFLYQNQGGAFFYMAYLLAAALAFREWRASGHVGRHGGPYFVVAAGAVVLAGASVFSASFAAVTGVIAATLVIIPAWWASRPRSGDAGVRHVSGIVVVVALIGALGGGVVYFSDLEPVWAKLMYKYDLLGQAKVDDRAPMREATWLMIRDNSRVFGAGAGAYRWISPDYFARFAEFRDASGALVARANYAHCDWLQMLAEWGFAGMATVVATVVWVFHRLRVSKVLRNAVLWPVLAGCLFLVVHATFDYMFFNPAMNLLFAFCLFVSLAWAREQKI